MRLNISHMRKLMKEQGLTVLDLSVKANRSKRGLEEVLRSQSTTLRGITNLARALGCTEMELVLPGLPRLKGTRRG